MEYVDRLHSIGITLLEPFTGAKAHHRMQCTECSNVWVATPLSKLQAYKKYQHKGCPTCSDRVKYTQIRSSNIQKLTERGLDVVSNWDGQTCTGKQSKAVAVTVRNTQCGHTFTSSAKNLLTRGVSCPICAKQYKTNVLNDDSVRRSNRWRKTAPEWKVYRSKVTSLTRISYLEHESTINPTNLPTGRAGTAGAYHLDHIVPVRYCYERDIPPELCAHHTNLQMLPWRENVSARDHLKEDIPAIFNHYIK